MNARSLGLVASAILVSVNCISCGGQSTPTQPTCSYSISPSEVSMGSQGGSGTVSVTAGANCSWSASSSANWIAITGGASGSGPGTVSYSIDANAATATRSGSLTIGGQTYAVTQAARAAAICSYELSPGSADFTKDGGAGTFTVTAPAGCAWTASSSGQWILINSGTQGSGPATVSYSVTRQSDTAGRTGAIIVSDKGFTIRQSGDVGACLYSVTPVAFSPCMPAGTVTATISTQTSCPWTAASNASWLVVPSAPSGTGSATVSMSFSDNYDAPREGIVMLRWPTPAAGQNVHVAQAGCRYAVSRTAIGFTSSGGSGTFDVIQQSDPTTCGGATQDRCIWMARSDVGWITITSSMPRAGDNPVAFTVAPNDATTARVGTIIVRDQVVTISQAGK